MNAQTIQSGQNGLNEVQHREEGMGGDLGKANQIKYENQCPQDDLKLSPSPQCDPRVSLCQYLQEFDLNNDC